MKTKTKKHTCRALMGLVALTTLVMAVNILPALAQQQTIRVGSELAVDGLSVAEQAARSFDLHEELMTIIPFGVENAQLRIEINQKDRDDLAVTPPSGTAPLRVGVVKSVSGNVGKPVGQTFNHGVVGHNSDGSFVWAITVTSPGAQAIRVHFTDFSLPDNTEMYFLGPNDQAHGPYVGKGRNNNGDFWTRSIVSDRGTVLLKYTGDSPDVDQPKMSFTISDVGHIRGRPPRSQEKSDDTWPCSDNAACLVDVNCVDTGLAAPAEDAVAKMEWIEGRYIYTCSGGLLADTDPDTQIPYFLTANHCLASDNSSLQTFFNYTTDSCEGFCPDNVLTGEPPSASTIGGTVVATGSEGDFTFLTLDESPPAGAVFLGWNNSPVAFSDGNELHRISNPNFGPQAYSSHVVDADSPTCRSWPRGERIYSKDTLGATMGGSSGSPVLNSEGEVVGQLSGCCGYNCGNVCDSDNNWTVDGALAYYWPLVEEFLDPQPECTTAADCDDGLYCNGTESCVGSVCQPGEPVVCNDNISCTDDSCDENTDLCSHIANNANCDDGFFCTGTEICDPDNDCTSGSNPCTGNEVCNDITDTCDIPVCNNNGTCELNEDCFNCPDDCISGTTEGTDCNACFKGKCDGICHPKEVGTDCPDCAVSYCCGDGVCSGEENTTTCAIDCGATPVTETNCSDGIDNDGDGRTDCADEDCSSDPLCSSSCYPRKAECTTNEECCSGKCLRNNTCK